MIMSESEGDEIIVVCVVLHSFFKQRLIIGILDKHILM